MNIIDKLFTIPEYPYYIIYPNGDIYSVKSKKFLKARYDKYGYKRVSIKNVFTKKLDTIKIHQLIGMCYLGYKKNSDYVMDHIDNDKNNNYIHNLQVITQKQNMRKEHLKKIKIDGLPYYIHNTKNGYCIKFNIDKKKFYFGIFNCLEDAVTKRNEYFKELLFNVKM